MSYVRLSVPVDRETAAAARRLREWIQTPAFSDLCAGVATLDVGTLERLHVGVSTLYHHTQEMMELARGERVEVAP